MEEEENDRRRSIMILDSPVASYGDGELQKVMNEEQPSLLGIIAKNINATLSSSNVAQAKEAKSKAVNKETSEKKIPKLSESDAEIEQKTESDSTTSTAFVRNESISPSLSITSPTLSEVTSESETEYGTSASRTSSLMEMNMKDSFATPEMVPSNDKEREDTLNKSVSVNLTPTRKRSNKGKDGSTRRRSVPHNAPLNRLPSMSAVRLHPDDVESDEVTMKIIVVGEPGVGKTTLVQRAVTGKYSQGFKYTIGADFSLKVIKWSDKLVVNIQLWDIGGQERYSTMSRIYYKESKAAMVVFDLTNARSLQAAARWKADIDSKVRTDDGRGIPTLLVGNKADLPCEVSDEDMENFARKLHFTQWCKVSAKNDENINYGIKLMVSHIFDMEKSQSKRELDMGFKLADIRNPPTKPVESSCGCLIA